MNVSWQLVNLRSSASKKCAFCQNWYDPTNSAIRPKAPAVGMWEFNPRAKAMCLKKNIELPAFHFCQYFARKI